MTSTPVLIEQLTLEGFLSFGPDPHKVALQPLNVLIGPNGAGKSNFVEAFSVLHAIPDDLPKPIREGGSVRDWLWRGEPAATRASITLDIAKDRLTQQDALRYHLAFGAQGDSFVVLDERLENAAPRPGTAKPYFYFGYENGRPMLNVKSERRELRREDINITQSILSQRKDPDSYPEITALAAALGKIRIYRNWSFGPDAPVRASCLASVRTDTLDESFKNLPARLAVLRRDPRVKRQLLQRLADLAPGFDDFEIVPEGGQLQLYVSEGTHSTPARRLSDGTLRFLCLLAVLLDPAPPPVVVLEEPELGLHPDTLPVVRDLLLDASTRTQLIVTTHSTILVDSFDDHPEAILICDKVDGATQIRRLDAAQIAAWREHGSLGQLWIGGHLGGTRW